MSKFKFAVLISGNGSNLGSMIEHVDNNKIKGNICCVFSNNPVAYGIERAKNAGLAYEVLDHREFKERDDFDSALVKKLEKYEPDLIVLAGFMRILSSTFIKAYEGKILNIHPSILPKYPGLNTHERAIKSGDEHHGITIHFVDESLDGGPICAQSILEIGDSNIEELKKRIHALEHDLYPKVIDWFAQGRLIQKDDRAYLDGKEIILKY